MEEMSLPIYQGKSMDAFEDVWNMWMGFAGVDDLIPADVLSLRCFAYSFGEDIARWFSSAQPVRSALEELCGCLGIREVCSIIPASAWRVRPGGPEWPVLLADICMGAEPPAVREEFYRGALPAGLLYRHRDGKKLVYASSGIPFVELTEGQVMEKISSSEGYVLTGQMPMRIQRPSATETLHRGMERRRSILGSPGGENLLDPDIFKREWDRASCLSIQYGLMNYQIQLSKVIQFCVREMQISGRMAEALNGILLRIGSVSRNCAYGEIAGIEREFWALLERIEEDSRV